MAADRLGMAHSIYRLITTIMEAMVRLQQLSFGNAYAYLEPYMPDIEHSKNIKLVAIRVHDLDFELFRCTRRSD